jgi:hypothetical protein
MRASICPERGRRPHAPAVAARRRRRLRGARLPGDEPRAAAGCGRDRDGWTTATRIAPRQPARWSRLLPESAPVGRGCTLEVDLSLASFMRCGGAAGRLELARATLAVSRRGAPRITVATPTIR